MPNFSTPTCSVCLRQLVSAASDSLVCSPAAELWLLVTSSAPELCTPGLKYVHLFSLLLKIHQDIFSQQQLIT